jgi:hypothetical protein
VRIPLSAGRERLPGIEKDGPFDDFGIDKNAAMGPRIIAKQFGSFLSVASFNDQKDSTKVGVWASQDNSPFLEKAIHEIGVLIPERLLTARQPGDPRRPWVSKHEKKGLAHGRRDLSG